MIEVKAFPKNMGDIPLNPQAMHSCLFSGLYEEYVNVNNVKRKFFTYLKPGLSYARPCVFVVPDCTNSTLSYIASSFWIDFANKENVFLFFLTPEKEEWSLNGTDADYMNQVYVEVQSRNYYVTIQDTMYAVGIGKGAIIAQQAAMKMTSEWAGLATFGDLSSDVMSITHSLHKENTVEDTELAVFGSKAPLPVWMMWNSNTDVNAEIALYWKSQNHVSGERYTNDFADEIYFPTTIWKKSQLNDQLISEVRITNNYSGTLTCETWMPVWQYLKKNFRYRSRGKMLRRRKELKDYGLKKHSIQHDGYTRIWYEYVPDSIKNNSQAVPLVAVLHARGSSAEFYISLSDMTTIAEERGFIAVFPESSCYQQKPDGLSNVPLWKGSYQGKDFDDTGFILKMIDDIKARRNIDETKVYACGQSSGAMMSSTLGLTASKVFAAVACSSALINPEREVPQPKDIDPQIPYLFLFGEDDWLVADKNGDKMPFGCNDDIAKFLQRLIYLYDLNEKPVEYTSGEIHFYVFYNQKRVPMLTVGEITNMSHAIYPREFWLMYDEFLTKYSRDKDGSLLYMGEKVMFD